MNIPKYCTGTLLALSREHLFNNQYDLVLTSEDNCIYITRAACSGFADYCPVSSSWAKGKAVYDIISLHQISKYKNVHIIRNIDTDLDTLAILNDIQNAAASCTFDASI